MDKVKKIINCYVPVTACNFKCHYCYVGQTNSFKGEILNMNHSIDETVYALRKERWGGSMLLNFCASGETLLAPYIIPLVKLLLKEGHYCTIVTNGVLEKPFDEILQIPKEDLQRLFVKFSFHFLQLKEKNLFNQFFLNVNKIKSSVASYTVELTANDESIPYIDEIKKVCMDNLGAWCHIIESRDMNNEMKRLTKLPVEEHLKAWNSFDTPLIHFQERTFEQKRKEFCYAGDWAITLNLNSGDVGYCLGYGKKIANIFDDIEKPVPLVSIGCNCPWEHCWSSYFVMTNGVIPEFNSPYYYDLRDRICMDGSNWVKNPVKDFFSSKLVDSNPEYSEYKKYYINALQAKIWDVKDYEYDKNKLVKIIKKSLLSKGIRTLIIYDRDERLDLVIDLLKQSKIKVKNGYKIRSGLQKLWFRFLQLTSPVLVVDYRNVEKIKCEQKFQKKEFISIYDIVS